MNDQLLIQGNLAGLAEEDEQGARGGLRARLIYVPSHIRKVAMAATTSAAAAAPSSTTRNGLFGSAR